MRSMCLGGLAGKNLSRGIAVHAQHVLRMFFVSINNLVQKKIETGDFMWYALCQ